MALSIDYAPISAALALGNQAGQGIFNQRQIENQFQQQGLNQQAQAEANRVNANQIQEALTGRQITQQGNLANAQLQAAQAYHQQEMQYHNDSLQSLNAYRGQNMDVRQQQVDNQADYRDQSLGIRQQLADTSQQRADQAPAPADRASQQLESEYNRLAKQEAVTVKQAKQFSYDPNDVNDLLAQPSQSVKGSKAGFEARFTDATNTLSRIQQRKQQIEDGLRQRIDPLLQQQAQGQPPAPSAQASPAPQPQGQQSAPSQPRIVSTATNPQTGQKMGFDASAGQWVPINQ